MPTTFPDGVWWVPLAAAARPGARAPARRAGARRRTSSPAGRSRTSLAAMLGGKRMLLAARQRRAPAPGAAAAIADAARRSAGRSCVVTSRERLQLAGEQRLPGAAARRRRGRRRSSPRAPPRSTRRSRRRRRWPSSASGSTTCRSHSSSPRRAPPCFSPEQILERLGERLDLLKGGRDADPRQQTLRATIAWSLRPARRPRSASSSRASPSSPAARRSRRSRTVCGADLDTLASLVDKSLVRRDGDRFWMLETIREFGTRAARRRGARGRDRAPRRLLRAVCTRGGGRACGGATPRPGFAASSRSCRTCARPWRARSSAGSAPRARARIATRPRPVLGGSEQRDRGTQLARPGPRCGPRHRRRSRSGLLLGGPPRVLPGRPRRQPTGSSRKRRGPREACRRRLRGGRVARAPRPGSAGAGRRCAATLLERSRELLAELRIPGSGRRSCSALGAAEFGDGAGDMQPVTEEVLALKRDAGDVIAISDASNNLGWDALLKRRLRPSDPQPRGGGRDRTRARRHVPDRRSPPATSAWRRCCRGGTRTQCSCSGRRCDLCIRRGDRRWRRRRPCSASRRPRPAWARTSSPSGWTRSSGS